MSADWLDNSRTSFDLSTRSVSNLDTNQSSSSYVLGLDFHKVFSSDSGDIGTLTFQPYYVRLNNVASPPPAFHGDNDALTWRIANFNYTAASQGAFNVRIGHFEVPFGLEQNVDTNGTLRQFTAGTRRPKADWGLSVNGATARFDYEISMTRGSGNQIHSAGNPYIFAGRVGTPSTDNMIHGVSWMDARINSTQGPIDRQRVGYDFTYRHHPVETMLEFSAGRDDDDDILNALMDISWRDNSESWHVYGQLSAQRRKQLQDWQSNSQVAVGLDWTPSTAISVGAQFSEPLSDTSAQATSSKLSLQVRLRL